MHRGNVIHTQNWDEPDTACVRIECMSDRKESSILGLVSKIIHPFQMVYGE